MGIPKPDGVSFDGFEEGEVIDLPPDDLVPFFVCIEPSREESLRVLVCHAGDPSSLLRIDGGINK